MTLSISTKSVIKHTLTMPSGRTARRMPQCLSEALDLDGPNKRKFISPNGSKTIRRFMTNMDMQFPTPDNASSESDSSQKKTAKSQSLPNGTLLPPVSYAGEQFDKKKQTTRPPKSKAKLLRKQLIRKFRVVARIVIFMVREARRHQLRNKVFDEVSPYVQSLQFLDFQPEQELLFDRTKFKANKQLRISEETKRILTKPSTERMEKDIYYAVVSLRNNSSFAEYPIRMQRKIAEVGTYCRFEAKRVIVRQGHPATSFYFILSGSIVVMVYQGDTKVPKPVAYLKKGQTFGELAIIHSSARQATCIAKEPLELLAIDFRDFHRIFMAGGVKNINDPDQEQFLRNIIIFDGWPIENLAKEGNESKSLFHYFKNGEVLVKDSNFSDWIIIVKSGSVNLLKKLRRVKPYERKSDDDLFKTEKQKREEKRLLTNQRRIVLPDLHIPLRDLEETDNFLEKALLTSSVMSLPMMYHRSHSVLEINLPKKAVDSLVNPGSNADTALTNGRADDKEGDNPGQTDTTINSHSSVLLPSIQSSLTDMSEVSSTQIERKRDIMNISASHESVKSRANHLKEKSLLSESPASFKSSFSNVSNGKMEHGIQSSTSANKFIKSVHKHVSIVTPGRGSQSIKKLKTKKKGLLYTVDDDEVLKQLENHKNNIRTVAHDIDSKFKDPDDLTEADLDPQFVHLQTLTKGMFFGLYEMVFEEKQPSFCLVSNGAECILINKQFYWNLTTEELRRKLLLNCSPYPSDEDMQDQLQTTIDWQAYKNSTFQNTLSVLHKHTLTKPVLIL